MCRIKVEGDRQPAGRYGSSFRDSSLLGLQGSILLSGSLPLAPMLSNEVKDLAQEDKASLVYWISFYQSSKNRNPNSKKQ